MKDINYESLNKLRREFKERFPRIDYFTQDSIFWFMDAAFDIGYKEAMRVQARTEIKVTRSDGVKYQSIVKAANLNKVSDTAIRKALLNGSKSAGYYWKTA